MMAATRVLIVEDDAMLSAVLAELLSDHGYEICGTAASEPEAVAAAARDRPDLLIVDDQLREGTGGAAVERIYQERVVPCVFMSGAMAFPDRARRQVLRKPFMLGDLLIAIDSAMSKSGTAGHRAP
jgi:CheY-like chemotaxis protein